MLDLLYSTYNERLANFIKNVPNYNSKVKVIVVHQIFDCEIDGELFLSLQKLLRKRSDISYFSLYSRGVAKSRNFALSKSTGRYVLFCDDDVEYFKCVFDVIISSFSENPKFKFLTFAYNIHGKGRHPKFNNNSKVHNRKTILSVGTIEIALDREYVTSHNVFFPENLGAGAKYYLCDEPVFLGRLLANEGEGKYIPVSICSHPDESSGEVFNGKYQMKSRLIAFRYIFGNRFGTILYYAFLLKNIQKLRLRYYWFSFVGVHFFD